MNNAWPITQCHYRGFHLIRGRDFAVVHDGELIVFEINVDFTYTCQL